jgi:hypothetical protein
MTNEEMLILAKRSGWLDADIEDGFEPLWKFANLVAEKSIEEAHYIIFKSCINQPHWKRSAMRYLKRNAPMFHYQAVHEFNEHPDGRGKE